MFASKKTAAPSGETVYIESVFSTYLYTGNGSTQTITNGIDLSGKGGLVWVKGRSVGYGHGLFDTLRGADYRLDSASTDASTSISGIPANAWITGFNSNGFGIGTNGSTNSNGTTYASWTFRKQAKFFDVVTYTGNGTARTISHNLGSTPGCVIVKRTDTTGDWYVYHRSNTANPETDYLLLNTTAATADLDTVWNDTAPTSTVFSVGTNSGVNANTGTYVAYLFAHDAGGFGLTGSDNVISCGSYTGNGSATGPTVSLGYEPQWVLVKRTDSTSNWTLSDNMRGQPVDGATAILYPNASDAEASATTAVSPTATGFQVKTAGATYNASGGTYIYIAIRRGPMKVPTSGTSVFASTIWTGSTPNPTDKRSIAGFGKPTDLFIGGDRDTTFNKNFVYDRLRGTDSAGGKLLKTYLTDAETSAGSGPYSFAQMDGITLGDYLINYSGRLDVGWFFGRAPSFFDVVCYTGTGSARTVTHNLAAVPELMIVKTRSTGGSNRGWFTYVSALGNANALELQNTNASQGASIWNSTTPTSSVFSVDGSFLVNENTTTYVAYLFATCAGVSKVGSYTGTGALQTINCGFAAGARFVLIKRTDTTGDWYVWDTARGIVSGNDPYLLLNSTAVEVTNTDYIDPINSGFEISSTAPAAINANGGTFIFLAVA